MDYENKKFKYLAVTHDGPHHMDDVMAAAILQLRFSGSVKVVRTNAPEDYPEADFVFDTGRTYNLHKGRFDHHQGKSDPGLPTSPSRPKGYAAAGLVWRRFGIGVCKKLFCQAGNPEVSLSVLRRTFDAVDNLLMRPIDNWDNGANKTSREIIPVQYMAAAMNFSHAVNASMKMLSFYVSRCVTSENEMLDVADTINTDDGIQVWFFGSHVVFQSRPNESLQLITAKKISQERYQKDVLAVVSCMKKGGSVLYLGTSVRVRRRFWEGLNRSLRGKIRAHESRMMFFCEDQEPLIDFVRVLATSAGALEKASR